MVVECVGVAKLTLIYMETKDSTYNSRLLKNGICCSLIIFKKKDLFEKVFLNLNYDKYIIKITLLYPILRLNLLIFLCIL